MTSNFITNPISADAVNINTGDNFKYLKTNKERMIDQSAVASLDCFIANSPNVFNTPIAGLTAEFLGATNVIKCNPTSASMTLQLNNSPLDGFVTEYIKSVRQRRYVPNFISNNGTINTQQSGQFTHQIIIMNYGTQTVTMTATSYQILQINGPYIIPPNSHIMIEIHVDNIDSLNQANNRMTITIY
jgi:hypothetical protein